MLKGFYLTLSGSHLKKQTVHECDFVDMYWFLYALVMVTTPSAKLNSEECIYKTQQLRRNQFGKLVTLKDNYTEYLTHHPFSQKLNSEECNLS